MLGRTELSRSPSSSKKDRNSERSAWNACTRWQPLAMPVSPENSLPMSRFALFWRYGTSPSGGRGYRTSCMLPSGGSRTPPLSSTCHFFDPLGPSSTVHSGRSILSGGPFCGPLRGGNQKVGKITDPDTCMCSRICGREG